MSDIKIGTRVKIVQPGMVFDTYSHWPGIHQLPKWKRGEPPLGLEGTVTVVGQHESSMYETIYGARMADGTDRILSKESFEVVGQSMPFQLKPYMRVKTTNGQFWAIMPGTKEVTPEKNLREGMFMVYTCGFNPIAFAGEEMKYPDLYAIVEVYAAPNPADLLNVEKKGALLWKYQDPAKKAKAATLRAHAAQLLADSKAFEAEAEQLEKEFA